MSKKKSYMNTKNILSEDVISSFLKGLFRGITRQKPKTLRKAKTDLHKKVDKFNKHVDSIYDYMNQIRKDNGLKPKKKPKRLTAKQMLDDFRIILK